MKDKELRTYVGYTGTIFGPNIDQRITNLNIEVQKLTTKVNKLIDYLELDFDKGIYTKNNNQKGESKWINLKNLILSKK